ncbi:MAG: homoserine kinase [Candidatus Promineifilaceae bacterium]
MTTVKVTVPATTANLGPGFDCLGMALGLHNEVTFTETDSGLTVVVQGEGAGKISADSGNLVIRSAEYLFHHVGRRPSGMKVVQENNIPVGSGLGSSASAVLAGLLGANALMGEPLSRSDILTLAVEIEGHPDNVAPALFGGLVLAVQENGRSLIEPISVPDMTVVIVLPEFNLPTADARGALPEEVPMADAIFNIGRMGLLVRALADGDYERLASAMVDRLHQPYRLPLIPGMPEAFTAVREAGAAAVALSGAGPSLIAFAPDNHEAIAQAAEAAFAQAGLPIRHWLLPVDRTGSQIFL